MRAVLQRVSAAGVTVDGRSVGEIGAGLLVLLGVAAGDGEADAHYLAEKTARLRIFEDTGGKMNLSLTETGGKVLVVSQFTLLADCRQGRRPSFTRAAPPAEATYLYEAYVARLRELGLTVATGVFQAMMEVRLVNQGPVTMLLDSRKEF